LAYLCAEAGCHDPSNVSTLVLRLDRELTAALRTRRLARSLASVLQLVARWVHEVTLPAFDPKSPLPEYHIKAALDGQATR